MYLCTWACHHSSVPLLWLAEQLLKEAEAYERHSPMAGHQEFPKLSRKAILGSRGKDCTTETNPERNLFGPVTDDDLLSVV